MSSSSLQEDRPTDTGAIIFNLESVKLIREVFTELLEITHTMQKTIRTEFLNIVESFTEVFRWYLELYKDGVEVASHTYITAHDLHHQVQAQRFALQNSRPFKPIQEYNATEVAIASASRGTPTAMRNIRELVRTPRQMTHVYEWTIAELCSVKTLELDLLEARLTRIFELFDSKVGGFEMVALEGTGSGHSRAPLVRSPALRAATSNEAAVLSV